ncbi:MAG: AMIN domain-containing protein, partial [Candidatus Gastranaerophilales bacterium]|nr:AMIN domain-containing protein [Candidatus Gastranaerophilales bacterium]
MYNFIRMNKFIKKINWITLTLLLVLFFTNQFVYAQNAFEIRNFNLDEAKTLFVINGNNNDNYLIYKEGYLSNPSRYFVDIENAVLTCESASLEVFEEGLTNITIAQFSNKPDVVRVVFTADDTKRLEKISIRNLKNSIIFKLGKITTNSTYFSATYQDKHLDSLNKAFSSHSKSNAQNTLSGQPINIDGISEPVIEIANLADTNKIISKFSSNEKIESKVKESLSQNIITTVKIKNNQVMLSGAGILSVKKPFTLNNPSRIVFDIANAVPANFEILNEFDLKNKDKIKIGQFDDETIRIVVNTKIPNNYRAIISPDMQSIIIADSIGLDLSDFPDTTS